jgi:hypothetical protein
VNGELLHRVLRKLGRGRRDVFPVEDDQFASPRRIRVRLESCDRQIAIDFQAFRREEIARALGLCARFRRDGRSETVLAGDLLESNGPMRTNFAFFGTSYAPEVRQVVFVGIVDRCPPRR